MLGSEATYFLNADGASIGEHDATALCERLPHEAGIVAIPTAAFAADPLGPTRSLVRFAFPKRDEVIDEAIERLARWASRAADDRGKDSALGGILGWRAPRTSGNWSPATSFRPGDDRHTKRRLGEREYQLRLVSSTRGGRVRSPRARSPRFLEAV